MIPCKMCKKPFICYTLKTQYCEECIKLIIRVKSLECYKCRKRGDNKNVGLP
jgi:hypothetical protein